MKWELGSGNRGNEVFYHAWYFNIARCIANSICLVARKLELHWTSQILKINGILTQLAFGPNPCYNYNLNPFDFLASRENNHHKQSILTRFLELLLAMKREAVFTISHSYFMYRSYKRYYLHFLDCTVLINWLGCAVFFFM